METEQALLPLQDKTLPKLEVTLPEPELELPARGSQLPVTPARPLLTPEQIAEQNLAWEQERPFDATQEQEIFPPITRVDRKQTEYAPQTAPEPAIEHVDYQDYLSDTQKAMPRLSKEETHQAEMAYMHDSQEQANRPSTTTYPDTISSINTPLEQAIASTNNDGDISVIGTPEEIRHDVDNLLPLVALKPTPRISEPMPEVHGSELIPPPPPLETKDNNPSHLVSLFKNLFFGKRPEQHTAQTVSNLAEPQPGEKAKQSAQVIQDMLNQQPIPVTPPEKQPVPNS